MTVLEAPPAAVARRSINLGLQKRIELIVTPTFFVVLAAAAAAVWIYGDIEGSTAQILDPARLVEQVGQHVSMTFWSTLLVLIVAIPAGIFVTRPAFRKYTSAVLTVGNVGQAFPAFGLLVLTLAWLGQGQVTAIVALTVYSLLPVLRNTMVGLQQVDQSVIEAGRGMGLSKRQALFRIELPLAVPVILAGVRTALVINVGTAALGFLIGAGGLGVSISAGLQLRRDVAVFIAGAMVAMLALLIDFLAALAERYLRPKGI